jgi:hypothetical protein
MSKPTKAEIAAALREHMRQLSAKGGAKGGRARAKKMTAAERSESARRAVLARWKKVKKPT